MAMMRSRFDTDPTLPGEVDRIAADVGTPM